MRHPKTRSVWSGSFSICLALLLGAPALAGDEAGADQAEDGSRVVIREVTTCPEIAIGSGGSVHWLGLSNRGFLGIEASQLTPELRSHFGVPEDSGILVGKVIEDSAAAAAGLKVGDIITRVGEQSIGSTADLGRAVRNKEKGDSTSIEFWRSGSRRQAEATLQADERCAFDIGSALSEVDWSELEAMGSEISREAVQSALEGVRHAFEGVEWEEHFKELQEIDLEGLEERLHRVNERLQDLEKELEQRLEKEMSQLELERRRVEKELEVAERARRAEERALVERQARREMIEKDMAKREREAAARAMAHDRAAQRAEREREATQAEREQDPENE